MPVETVRSALPHGYSARLPYPVLRFMDGRQCLMEVDASTWGTVAKGDEVYLICEDDGTSLGAWVVDAVQHRITVRQLGDGEDARLVPLALLRVMVVELLRVEE